MSTAWIPPRRSYHLRVFAICLGLVVIALLSFLFGVQLEAIRPATGIIESANPIEVRAPIDGLVELSTGRSSARKLEPGEILKPGDVIASVSRDQSDRKLAAPDQGHWLVVKVAVAHLQAVKAGDLIARLVPADPSTGKACDLIAELQVAEIHAGDVAVGQPVRLYSSMFAQRLHGHADGRIERIEPMGEVGPNGERRFKAKAIISSVPFPLHLGSSVRAEIIVGKKQVYKIILEH